MSSFSNARTDDFRTAKAAFLAYLAATDQLNDVMAALGVATRNVDPLANFAEVIVARELDGIIQRATNKGFDVLTSEGTKVQVKSLRVTSDKPEDNWLTWRCCTREKELADGPLIDAHWLAGVTYLDGRPHSLLLFRIVESDHFPIVMVKDLYFRHACCLLETRGSLDPLNLRAIDLASWSAYMTGIRESRTLAALRDALLPKLLSCEIRVPAAEKIVEEVA